MWINAIRSTLFWKVLAELFILEFVIGFADSYEKARQDAVRRLNEQHRR
jgi:hypothetical protein